MRLGRYCIRLSRVFTSTVSWSRLCLAGRLVAHHPVERAFDFLGEPTDRGPARVVRALLCHRTLILVTEI